MDFWNHPVVAVMALILAVMIDQYMLVLVKSTTLGWRIARLAICIAMLPVFYFSIVRILLFYGTDVYAH